MLVEINNKTKTKIEEGRVKKVAGLFLAKYAKGKNLSIAFLGDKAMLKINAQYRGMEKPTDILSFVGDDELLGELIIDYSQVKRQAKKNKLKEQDELIFILVHGLFHLIGYNDETEKEADEMDKLTNKFIVNNL